MSKVVKNCKYCGKFAPKSNIESGYEPIYSGFELQEVLIFHRSCQILDIAKSLTKENYLRGSVMTKKDMMDYYEIDENTAIKVIDKAKELGILK